MNYRHQMAEEGSFYCQKGDHIRPLSHLRIQEGRVVCETHYDEMTLREAQEILARGDVEGAEGDLDLARTYPAVSFQSPLYGVPGLTSVSPLSLSLTRGGASRNVVMRGANLSASDTITITGLTVVRSDDSSEQITLTVSAPGGAAIGYYHLVFNGETRRNFARVTS